MAVYTTYGNATWTCPAGVTKAYVTLIGAGGGGGGWGDAGNFAGEAGKCGQALVRLEATVVPNNDYVIAVGFGGVAGVDGSTGAAGTIGTEGGDSSFAAWTAQGGKGGFPAGSAADCVAGIGIALSLPRNSIGGNIDLWNITGNTNVRGQGGMGGHIASYTSISYSHTAFKGAEGMVVVEW